MFNKIIAISLSSLLFLLTGCNSGTPIITTEETEKTVINTSSAIDISLSDSEITVNGEMISANTEEAVYIANDIIYYEEGKDAYYGEGTEKDAHSQEEALAHSVIHITKAGTYLLSGNLSKGQIFVDLGEDAKNDKDAVVTLVLNNLDITCTVAPAILFYDVYECGEKDESTATAYVDTSAAGANVIIADNSINTVSGAYVARIYEPGTTDKLHKYDGAFYSKRSMNINGEEKGNGVLHINASNEGLDSELHLTVNGGNITITSQNDGINTNEDNISVTTINGGSLTINAGLGEEGDGIDSNGFLVFNGGYVLASASERTPDGGIDADRDILINGGTVIACGNQNGAVSNDSKQGFLNLSVQGGISKESIVKLSDPILNSPQKELVSFTAIKNFSSLILSTPDINNDTSYSLNANGKVIPYSQNKGFGHGGMPPSHEDEFPMRPSERFNIPEVPEGLDDWMNETEIPEDIREWINSMKDLSSGFKNRGDFTTPPNTPVPNA